LNVAREAAIWELEEQHLKDKAQLARRQLKDLYFIKRYQMINRHEKVGTTSVCVCVCACVRVRCHVCCRVSYHWPCVSCIVTMLACYAKVGGKFYCEIYLYIHSEAVMGRIR